MSGCISSEMLAEFIDGTLSPEKRERVVAHLNTCEECYAVVSDTLALQDELAKQGRARIRKYLAYSLPASLAAAAVLLLVFRAVQPTPPVTGTASPALTRREAPSRTMIRPKPETASLPRSFAGDLAERLAGNNAAAMLAQIKGAGHKPRSAFGFSSAMTKEKAVFNIGASLVDLEISLKAKDNEKSDMFAKRLIELLKPMESTYGIDPLIIEGVRTGNDPARYAGLSRAVEASIENTKESVLLRFGAWVEASSLAAGAGNVAFMQPAAARGFTRELENSGAPIGVLKDLARLETIMASGEVKADQFKAIARLLADIKEMY